jgi:hypothetical protein
MRQTSPLVVCHLHFTHALLQEAPEPLNKTLRVTSKGTSSHSVHDMFNAIPSSGSKEHRLLHESPGWDPCPAT